MSQTENIDNKNFICYYYGNPKVYKEYPKKQEGSAMMSFSELVDKISGSSRGLGELLRAITFVGEGCGCYQNFDVRLDAIKWSREQLDVFIAEHLRTKYTRNEQDEDEDRYREKFIPDFMVEKIRSYAEGYTFMEDELTIDVFWYWDGDGTLAFRVRQEGKVKYLLVHHDCKNDYEWDDITPSDPVELQEFLNNIRKGLEWSSDKVLS